jgi:hypothetical protein
MFKRIEKRRKLVLLATFAILPLFAACGGDDDEESSSASSSTSSSSGSSTGGALVCQADCQPDFTGCF